MKMKLIFCLALCAIFTHKAFAQWVYKDTKNGITITYGIKLNVVNKDTSMVASLKVKDDVLKKTIDYGNISLTTSNVTDTVSLGAMLRNNYKTLFNTNGKAVILKHSQYVENMAVSIHDTLRAKFQRSYVYQGLLMYRSLLNGANRDTANKGNVNFTVLEGYPIVLTGFVCNQEVIINAAAFKTYLRERQTTDPENKGIGYYFNALANQNGDMTMSQIRVQLNTYFATTGGWPTGGQCGCCANYSGPCLYWNSICLAHDMACQKCQHSWCLSGCKPTSCAGNTIAWYWWAVKVITPYP
jgi:hypothetical protein